MPDLTISYPAAAGFRENLFSDQKTTRMIKLMASTKLTAAIKRQYTEYSLVLPLLPHCLPVFDEICATAMGFIIFFGI